MARQAIFPNPAPDLPAQPPADPASRLPPPKLPAAPAAPVASAVPAGRPCTSRPAAQRPARPERPSLAAACSERSMPNAHSMLFVSQGSALHAVRAPMGSARLRLGSIRTCCCQLQLPKVAAQEGTHSRTGVLLTTGQKGPPGQACTERPTANRTELIRRKVCAEKTQLFLIK